MSKFKVGDWVRVTPEARAQNLLQHKVDYGQEALQIVRIKEIVSIKEKYDPDIYVSGYELFLYENEIYRDNFLTAASKAIKDE